MKRKIISLLFSITILSITIFMPSVAYAAPSSQIYFEDSTGEKDNILYLGDTANEVITFKNSASSTLDDVASTIQNITLAAANLNPSRVSIDLTIDALWEIYTPNNILRASGTVTGSKVNGIYAPYSTSTPVDIYTWKIVEANIYTDSSQFNDGLKILRPQEYVNLTITIKCNNVVGDSFTWFFFRATEFQPESADIPVTDINSISVDNRTNLYYQDKVLPKRPVGWWPLHNSYDPYDDIGTGHVFEQVGSSPQYGWTKVSTIRAFSKADK